MVPDSPSKIVEPIFPNENGKIPFLQKKHNFGVGKFLGTDVGRTRDLRFTRATPYHLATAPFAFCEKVPSQHAIVFFVIMSVRTDHFRFAHYFEIMTSIFFSSFRMAQWPSGKASLS